MARLLHLAAQSRHLALELLDLGSKLGDARLTAGTTARSALSHLRDLALERAKLGRGDAAHEAEAGADAERLAQ